MPKFLLLVATTAFGLGVARPGHSHVHFSVNGEEGLTLSRFKELQSEELFYTLRVSHWAPGQLVFRAINSDTLRVLAKSGSEPIPINITGSYQHVDIDIAAVSESQKISVEIQFPQTMSFDEVQLSAASAAIDVSGELQGVEGALSVKSGYGLLRVHDLVVNGKVEVASMLSSLELSNVRMNSGSARVFNKHSMKVRDTEAGEFDLFVESGTVCLAGYHNQVCAHLAKGGEVVVEHATFRAPLRVKAMLSPKVSSKIKVRESFLPQDMLLRWRVHGDELPNTHEQVIEVDGFQITFGDLLTHGGLFSLKDHLQKRGADQLCSQIFRKASPGWSPSDS